MMHTMLVSYPVPLPRLYRLDTSKGSGNKMEGGSGSGNANKREFHLKL